MKSNIKKFILALLVSLGLILAYSLITFLLNVQGIGKVGPEAQFYYLTLRFLNSLLIGLILSIPLLLIERNKQGVWKYRWSFLFSSVFLSLIGCFLLFDENIDYIYFNILGVNINLENGTN